MKWFQKLKQGLQKSSSKITTGVSSVLQKKKLDQDTIDALETHLIMSDFGVSLASQFCQKLAKNRFGKDVSDDEVRAFLVEEIHHVLDPFAQPMVVQPNHKPHVILVAGVNGSGKTTTVAKLGKYWKEQGLSVNLVAADTFRAAAVEQLKTWGERLGVPVISGAAKADPAALCYEAITQAQKNQVDVLLIDTAGRLQNKTTLMEELKKIQRVIQKVDETAPHHGLLVLDATVGQNAYSQVEAFSEAIHISHLIMTKLDGTSRGGSLIGLGEKFQIPIHGIGVGEGPDDLQIFKSKDFAKALMGVET